MRHHTTGPAQPVRRVAPVAPVSAHRRGAPAQAMLIAAVRYYRSRLRAQAQARDKVEGGLSGVGAGAISRPALGE